MSQSEQQIELSEQQQAKIASEVQKMNDDALRAAVAKLKAAAAKRTQYTKDRLEKAKTDPVLKDKLITQRQAYNQSDAAKARRKAYFAANKEKIYASHKAYHAKQKALVAEAKRRGLDKELEAAS